MTLTADEVAEYTRLVRRAQEAATALERSLAASCLVALLSQRLAVSASPATTRTTTTQETPNV